VNLIEFRKAFERRHDFYSEDLHRLKNKYPEITFFDIPEAWIYKIDEHLSRMKRPSFLESINQICGFVVTTKSADPADQEIFDEMLEELYVIDLDIRKELDGESIAKIQKVAHRLALN
jgi:hypothetical protein